MLILINFSQDDMIYLIKMIYNDLMNNLSIQKLIK